MISTEERANRTVMVDVDAAVSTPDEREQVVAGYTLQHRLGVGGYGEVWRAIGPGGLPKAVKILHGRFDGPAADAELKSLELMRELRHPFLLNIERVETDNSRVVIVTELAECSLEDRFAQIAQSGKKGIPRDQLLAYMSDAADALDFMHEEHGLQHLDIKPGNLLIQGKHVKVADFGLIKNINQTNVSMIAGFTPLYAPPELFEGEPHRSSDQYSLAIVYQVMLTGTPPFAGRTAAQLTAQHLSSKPDLSALTPSDRSAIARALSKNSNARFPSCREFVDRLRQHRVVKTRTAASPDTPAESLNDTVPSTGTTQPIPSTARTPAVPRTPVPLGQSPVRCRPTLFVGIGGLAGGVLLGLRRRFSARCKGNAEAPGQPLSAFPLLYLDTDAGALRAVSSGDSGTSLSGHEILPMPLHDSNYYRSRSSDVLDWLSRRWLFNIPRSRNVEGLRPLGRLAFVDHHQQIRARLEQQLAQAAGEESLQQTADALGLPLAGESPDVVVVASISGGTGAGIVLDAGYLIRNLLNAAGLSASRVSGLLLHGTGQRDQVRRFQRANAIACLTEFQRFSNPQLGFPGAPTCHVPVSEQPPFDETCLIHLGDELSEADFDAEVNKIAEYLHRQTVTPAREFFDARRQGKPEKTSVLKAGPDLRTLGIARLDDVSHDVRQREAAALCRGLIQKWQEGALRFRDARPARTQAIRELNVSLLGTLELDVDRLLKKGMAISRGGIGKQVDGYFRQKLESWMAGGNHQPAELVSRIDREFAAQPADGMPAGHPLAVMNIVRDQLAQSARRSAQSLCAQTLAFADESDARLATVCESVSDLLHQLAETRDGLHELLTQTGSDRSQLQSDLSPPATDEADAGVTASADEVRAMCQSYAALGFCGRVLLSLVEHVDEIGAAVRSIGAKLTEAFAVTAAAHDSDTPTPPDSPLVQSFNDWARGDRRVQLKDWIADPEAATGIPATLRKAAIAFLLESSSRDGKQGGASLDESAQPVLTNVGGGRRVLAMLPGFMSADDWKPRLEKTFGDCVTIGDNGQDAPFICCEVDDIRCDLVIEQLAGDDPTVTEMAGRVHSRSDVDW